MLNKKFLSIISIITCLVLLFSSVSLSFADNLSQNDNKKTIYFQKMSFSSYKDISTHWAKTVMEKAYNDGLLNGFDDNTMRPDDVITGAQMAAILTRVMNATEKVDISSISVPDDAWYKDELSKAIAMGFVDSSKASTINEKMKRIDAFVMISDAFQISEANPDMTKAKAFSDFANLSYENKIIVASMVNNQYIEGYNGSLNLNSNITRAEFVTILYRLCGFFFNSDSSEDYSVINKGTVITGNSFNVSGLAINHNLWLDTKVKNININDATLSKLVVRSDNISKLNISNSSIKRLVLASRGGNITLDGRGIKTVNIGDGNGIVELNPEGNNVDITGYGRNVNIVGGTGTLAISGNYCTVNIADGIVVDRIILNGKGNTVTVNSSVNTMTVSGTNNAVNGNGTIVTIKKNNETNSISIKADNYSTETVDSGIKNMKASLSVPESVNAGSYLKAKLNLTDIAVGKTVNVTWYVNRNIVLKKVIDLTSTTVPTLNYYIDYNTTMDTNCKVFCRIEYTTASGETQTIDAPSVYTKIIKPNSTSAAMTAAISAPGSVDAGNYLKAALNLTNIAVGKTAKVTWYMDGKEATSKSIQLTSTSAPTLNYYIDYSSNLAASCRVSAKIEYTDNYGNAKTVNAAAVTVKLNKPGDTILSKVETQYKGNNTTDWAVKHNLSNADKVSFVNTKGYSSSTKYLIWVNIGTQYTSVFTGSKGNWKLQRSFLVSTGASDGTPRGVFKTTYKQSNWTTDTYTVKPVVRFYTGGYAFHSRLYKPGTTELQASGNALGYPLSHGCVRMDAENIQWIYDNVPNGTTVVVY